MAVGKADREPASSGRREASRAAVAVAAVVRKAVGAVAVAAVVQKVEGVAAAAGKRESFPHDHENGIGARLRRRIAAIMKAICVVGTKKTGKTTLVSALVRSLAKYGKVGTVKNMVTHSVDQGDTKRHFDAGADVVIGLGAARLKVTRERGDLASALADLEAEGVDYAVVEGFKHSDLPKFNMADIEVTDCLRKVSLAELNDQLIDELTEQVLALDNYRPTSPG